MPFDHARISNFKRLIEEHSLLIGGNAYTLDNVQSFMEEHVFAVWDFMTLAKTLQHHICPSIAPGQIWMENKIPSRFVRSINEMITCEESDLIDCAPTSHLGLYIKAMEELGTDTGPFTRLMSRLETTTADLYSAIASVSPIAADFCSHTFKVARTGDPCEVAAAFAYGRETTIPMMFRNFRTQMPYSVVSGKSYLQVYLARHIQVDGDTHGPIALELIDHLCDTPEKCARAENAAIAAILARERFWTSIYRKLQPK